MYLFVEFWVTTRSIFGHIHQDANIEPLIKSIQDCVIKAGACIKARYNQILDAFFIKKFFEGAILTFLIFKRGSFGFTIKEICFCIWLYLMKAPIGVFIFVRSVSKINPSRFYSGIFEFGDKACKVIANSICFFITPALWIR